MIFCRYDGKTKFRNSLAGDMTAKQSSEIGLPAAEMPAELLIIVSMVILPLSLVKLALFQVFSIFFTDSGSGLLGLYICK